MESWAAIVIGTLGSFVWMATAKLLIFLQIDDAVDAVPVHMSCGIWGLLAGQFSLVNLWLRIFMALQTVKA